MIRIILSLTLGLVITLLASGCTHGGEGRTVIRFWAMGNEAERVQQLIADFERSNPDVHVELQQVPWTAAHEKLLTAVAGDAMPDVCQLGNTWIPEFAVMNVLTPLAPFIVSTPSSSPMASPGSSP